jgi:XFP N-terminal domain
MTPASTCAKPKTGEASKATAAGPLFAEELRKIHAYWRAANYLSVGQIYLMDNPLLKEPLSLKHVKTRTPAGSSRNNRPRKSENLCRQLIRISGSDFKNT